MLLPFTGNCVVDYGQLPEDAPYDLSRNHGGSIWSMRLEIHIMYRLPEELVNILL